jgi:hypothetical protein
MLIRFAAGGVETSTGARRERSAGVGDVVQRVGRSPRSGGSTARGATVRWRHSANLWPGVGSKYTATAAAKRSTARVPGRHQQQ